MNDPSLTLNLLPQNSNENKRHVPYLGLTLPMTYKPLLMGQLPGSGLWRPETRGAGLGK